MLYFLIIGALSVLAVLAVQALDVECLRDPQPNPIKARPAKRPSSPRPLGGLANQGR